MTAKVQRLADQATRTGRKVIIHAYEDSLSADEDWFNAMVKCAHCRFRWIALWVTDMPSLTCPQCSRETRIRLVKK
jgi:hypothetical protein